MKIKCLQSNAKRCKTSVLQRFFYKPISSVMPLDGVPQFRVSPKSRLQSLLLFSVLCTQIGQSKQEEWNVSYSPELASESLYFGIERLCPGIGLPVHEKIKYGIIVIYKSANDGLKGISSQLFNFIEPSCQFEPCHILDAFPVEDVRQFHGKLISPL